MPMLAEKFFPPGNSQEPLLVLMAAIRVASTSPHVPVKPSAETVPPAPQELQRGTWRWYQVAHGGGV